MNALGVSPQFEGSELHLHISGSVSASLMPWWINWIRFLNPDVIVNVSVSIQARRFVTIDAARALVNGEAWIDDWSSADLTHSWRDGRSGASECILIAPATLDTVMRLAQGRSDSPALMMMQITQLPIVIADVFPADNAVIEHWRALLLTRENIAFAPRIEASRADDRSRVPSGFDVPGAIHVANERLRRR